MIRVVGLWLCLILPFAALAAVLSKKKRSQEQPVSAEMAEEIMRENADLGQASA